MKKRKDIGPIDQVALEQGWLGREPPEFRQKLRELLTVKIIPAGKLIFASGDEADALYGVMSGHFAIRSPLASGEETVAHVCSPGFWIGATMIASQFPRRQLAAIARTDGSLAFVRRADLRRFLKENPQHWYSIARLIECHGVLITCIAQDLMLRRHRDRIAATLLRLAGLRPKIMIHAQATRLWVTHDEIATMSNCSKSLVHAELRRFEDQGWIALSYGSISVLAPEEMIARFPQ